MKNSTHVKKLTIAAMAVAINIVLGSFVAYLAIPLLFLDTVGTIYVSAAYGMRYGILVGVVTNLVLGVTTGPTAIPFALVNVAVAVVVSLMAKNGFGYTRAIITGLILAVVCPLIGTPIRLILFGGFTGSGTDILIAALVASGKEIFSATFISTVASNLVDKVASCMFVAFLLIRMNPNKSVLPKTQEQVCE